MLDNSATPTWFLYLIRDTQNRLYTGISTDVARRFAEHQTGKGARALRGRGPLTLVWQQAVGSRGTALKLEYRIKQWSKARKETWLASGRPLDLQDLD